jgi:hypothetical protein
MSVFSGGRKYAAAVAERLAVSVTSAPASDRYGARSGQRTAAPATAATASCDR